MKKIFFFTLICLAARGVSAQNLELTSQAWKADIRYMQEQLSDIHPNAFHTISSAVFNERAETLMASVEKKSGTEITVGLMRLLAGIGDGNTRLDWRSLDFQEYPVRYRFFENQARLVAADSLYQRWLGLPLLRVNRYAMADVQEKLLELIPAKESLNHAYVLMQEYLRRPEILGALGLLDQRYSIIMLEDPEGTRIKAPLVAKDSEPQYWFKSQAQRPAHFLPPYDAVSPGLWVNTLAGGEVTFLFAGAYPEENNAWKTIYKQIKSKLKESTASKVLIDLRENDGGNFKVGKKLIRRAAKSAGLKKGGRLYIAIGRRTYAAATLDAFWAREKYGAVLLGETTGASLNGYREDEVITLPNSGLRVFIPTKKFEVLEGHTGGLTPDQAIPWDWEHYQKGEDPVLEWVLDK